MVRSSAEAHSFRLFLPRAKGVNAAPQIGDLETSSVSPAAFPSFSVNRQHASQPIGKLMSTPVRNLSDWGLLDVSAKLPLAKSDGGGREPFICWTLAVGARIGSEPLRPQVHITPLLLFAHCIFDPFLPRDLIAARNSRVRRSRLPCTPA
jgi:hypothetical protein